MKKTIFLIILLISTTLATGCHINSDQKEPIVISVNGPMSGANAANGLEMVRGASMYIDEINQTGGIFGRKIKIQVNDDKSDVQVAVKIASQIVQDKDVLVVLGHYFSSTSILAGEIYKTNGLPAITASATRDRITTGNDYYFRTISKNSTMGRFAIKFIQNILKPDSITLIADTSSYGKILPERINKYAKEVGIVFQNQWIIDSSSPKNEQQLKKIIATLRANNSPGLIFLVTNAATGAKIISSLQYPGSKYTFLGPDSFSNNTFISELKNYKQELAVPGYYSNGIYSIPPSLPDVSGQKTIQFARKYFSKFNEEATWIASNYYEAAKVAIEAIKITDLRGKNDFRGDRRRVKESLLIFSSDDIFVDGLDNKIYFDSNGDVNKSMIVAKYTNQILFPHHTQLSFDNSHSLPTPGKTKEKPITIHGKKLSKNQIIKIGIDIHKISNLDIKQSKVNLVFYIWFRYSGEFNPEKIKFLNTASPIVLNKPILEKKVRNQTVKAFLVEADFLCDLNFTDYPFDSQKLNILLRHSEKDRNSLILIPDTLGIRPFDEKLTNNFSEINRVDGWHVNNIALHHALQNLSNASNAFRNFSHLNSVIKLSRENFIIILKNIAPVIIAMIITLLAYFLPLGTTKTRMQLIACSIIILVSNHLILLSSIQCTSIMAIEYAYGVAYFLNITAVLISLLTSFFSKSSKKNKALRILKTGKTIHLIIFTITVIGYLYKFGLS
jgi:ABC-type branched-subunit amino acid transport system substrate-binding protein